MKKPLTSYQIGKYMDCISLRQNQYFSNYGTDEYANDATDACGLVLSETSQPLCVRRMPPLAAMAKESFRQPMAFNDGFYYEDKDDMLSLIRCLLISYWSKG